MIAPIPTPENWQELRSHEYANIFPLVPTDDLEKTLPTMWSEGYDATWPIVLYEGQILDGRNRLRAAIQAKREPTFAAFTGSQEKALDWAIRANLHRRQLTDPQRAMVAARIEPLFAAAAKERQRAAGGDRKSAAAKSLEVESPQAIDEPAPKKRAPQSRDLAAAALNVSPETVGRAKTLLNQAPDLAEKVDAGEMGVWTAEAELRERQGKPKRRGKQGFSQPNGSEGGSASLGEAPLATAEPPAMMKVFDQTMEEPPTHHLASEPYACQTERHTNPVLMGTQAERVTLHKDLIISADRLAMYYDKNQLVGFIKLWSRFWLPSTLQRVIDALNEEKGKR